MEDFSGKIYVGVVEDNVDPKRLGRCRVRVPFTYDVLPLENLPWASPFIEPNGKAFSVPPVGKIVNVIFDNGNLYMPYYKNSEKYNINLQDKLESISEEEYTTLIALVFDHRTRIYAEKEGLTLDYLVNKIRIDKSSINLELKNNDGRLNLGSTDADQPVVLGDHFVMDWFVEFMKILVKPTSLVGNYSAPILKPELDIHIQKFLVNPKKYVSSNVFVVDNRKVKKLERDAITSEVEHDDTKFVTPKEVVDGGSGGVNVEKSTRISKDAQTKIQDTQTATKQELVDADSSSSVTLASELDKSTLAEIKVPMRGIIKGTDLSQTSMKDLINTSKVNLSTDDLSKIKRKDLNLNVLKALGFGTLAIIGISILVIARIKAINKRTKKKRKILSSSKSSTVSNPVTDTTDVNEEEIVLQNVIELDLLETERINQLTKDITNNTVLLKELENKLLDQNYVTTVTPDTITGVENSVESLKSLETKLLDQNYVTTVTLGTIIEVEDSIEVLKTLITEQQQELNNMVSNSQANNTPLNTMGSDTTSYNQIDQYSKKRKDAPRIVSNSNFTIDKRNRTDVLNSTEAVSTKKRTTLYKNNPNYGRYYNSFNI